MPSINFRANSNGQKPIAVSCETIPSSIQTLTVGSGISPDQSQFYRESRTLTAGRELHPALKKFQRQMYVNNISEKPVNKI